MSQDGEPMIEPEEAALLGSLVEGRVVAVFRWGVIVDLGLSHVGLIDALYIDDHDTYREGDIVSAYLTSFDERMEKFWLRPPGQVPVSERLREKGF
jgi:ribosomal protein S1